MSVKLRNGLLIALGCVLLLLAAAYVFRNPLATKLTAIMLDRSGDMRCTHPDVRISPSLQRVMVSPLKCEMLKPGPLKAFESHSEAVLTLSGLTPTRIYVSRATMDQREREVENVESNIVGDLANVAGIRDNLVKGMLDASESFSPGGPVLEADTMIAKRAGKVDSIMKHFRRSYEDGWDCQRAERMESPGGSGPVTMRDFEMRATSSQAKLRLALYLGKAKAGEEPDIALKMDATGLDGNKPRVVMRL